MARLSEEKREAIKEDLRRTHGTTEGALRRVAARHDVSMSSVRKIAVEMKLDGSQARSRTKNATAAIKDDLATQRAELSRRMVAAAHRALDDMESPAVIYNFGGKDNTYNEKSVPRPPTGDQRNLMIIAATALDKHRMLDQYDAQLGFASAVDDWLVDKLGVRREESGS